MKSYFKQPNIAIPDKITYESGLHFQTLVIIPNQTEDKHTYNKRTQIKERKLKRMKIKKGHLINRRKIKIHFIMPCAINDFLSLGHWSICTKHTAKSLTNKWPVCRV